MNTFINGTYNTAIENLTEQIDGKIETWFQTTDPSTSWTTTELKKRHVGDMWYNSSAKKLKRYASTYVWADIDDQKAIDAYTAASQAQDTADGKRRVFVTTPYPPYDIGDLWVNGIVLKRCATARKTGSYIANDWVLAVTYDNTKTVIDGGIVTSGTIQLAGSGGSILAGITGNGTAATSIRIWAGASYENRATAPFRVLQDGSVVMSKATVEGVINAISGYIGGFEIAPGRIGMAESSGMAGSNDGLTILSSFIKFSKSNIWVGMGTNVNPTSSGYLGLCRLEYSGSSYSSGTGLYVKFRPSYQSSWYYQKAISYDGNFFGVGGKALFEDIYIGKAYTSIIQDNIGKCLTYVFNDVGVSYLGVDLPTPTQIANAVGKSDVTFELQIVFAHNSHNRIRIRGASTNPLLNNNCDYINGDYGWVDMARGDVLILRYAANHYYIMQYRT